MALIKHHLIFQNVFAYNISNDNNVDFLKILFILVSNSMYRYFIITYTYYTQILFSGSVESILRVVILCCQIDVRNATTHWFCQNN
jgi:hypothetical protein